MEDLSKLNVFQKNKLIESSVKMDTVPLKIFELAVAAIDDDVALNGKELEEDYLQDGIVTDVSNTELYTGFDDFIVPDNCVFAMGDNRPHSTDCRAFGCIPLEKIESKVALRIWPLNLWGKVE